MKNLNTFKVDESARESMRVHESSMPNESESLNSHQLSFSFGPGVRVDESLTDSRSRLAWVDDSWWELTKTLMKVNCHQLWSSFGSGFRKKTTELAWRVRSDILKVREHNHANDFCVCELQVLLGEPFFFRKLCAVFKLTVLPFGNVFWTTKRVCCVRSFSLPLTNRHQYRNHSILQWRPPFNKCFYSNRCFFSNEPSPFNKGSHCKSDIQALT